MPMIDPIVQELEYETKATRAMLERIPENQWGWKPHEKSMTMAALASHIAEMFCWASVIVEMDVFELKMDEYTPFMAESKAQLLEAFDKNVAGCIERLKSVPDDALMVNWQMVMDGKALMEMPRVAVIKSMQNNHLIHHRAQLGLYLRLNDVPVPPVYGPSADEEG